MSITAQEGSSAESIEPANRARALILELKQILDNANGAAQGIRGDIETTLLQTATRRVTKSDPRFTDEDLVSVGTAKGGSPGDWYDNEDQMTHGGNGKGGNWITD